MSSKSIHWSLGGSRKELSTKLFPHADRAAEELSGSCFWKADAGISMAGRISSLLDFYVAPSALYLIFGRRSFFSFRVKISFCSFCYRWKRERTAVWIPWIDMRCLFFREYVNEGFQHGRFSTGLLEISYTCTAVAEWGPKSSKVY